MAYRKVHESFWTDPEFEEYTPEQKYFYLYLITCPSCNQIGLYEFGIRRAELETGYNKDTIEKLLQFFEDAGKIIRSKKTKEILVRKFYNHNKSSSPKVLSHVDKLLDDVKDTVLIQYIYGMHTGSQKEEEEEKEEEETQLINTDEGVDFESVVDFWNQLFNCQLRLTDKKRSQIRARLKSFSKQEIGIALKNRVDDPWLNSTEGQRHLHNWDSFWRNDEKVEYYLNQKEKVRAIYD